MKLRVVKRILRIISELVSIAWKLWNAARR